MSTEKAFIELGLRQVDLQEYLANELGKAGFGGIEIRRLPTGTRITLYVEHSAMAIGRKGRNIQQLTEDLARKYGIENPQVEVAEVKNPELCAPIMARRIAFSLERGVSVRRIGYAALRRIMAAGARGAEIVISGKIAGERSRSDRFYQGYLSKAGEPSEKFVSYGYAAAKLRPGMVGVKVRIMPPDAPLPDLLGVGKPEGEAAEAGGEAQEGPEETPPEGESEG